jgi:hypothetical protein
MAATDQSSANSSEVSSLGGVGERIIGGDLSQQLAVPELIHHEPRRCLSQLSGRSRSAR